MPKTIIADASCFIVLAKIGELDILQKIYGTVATTKEVVTEFGETLPAWIEVMAVKDTFRQQLLELQIDKGESSAIALAMEMPGSLVILDDIKARKIADKLGLSFTGTVGVIIKAKLSGIISSIKPVIEKIKTTDFHLSPDLERLALFQARE